MVTQDCDRHISHRELHLTLLIYHMLNINLHVLKVNVNDRKSTDCIKSG